MGNEQFRMRFAHILFYASGAGETRSADYNMMPRSAPIKLPAHGPQPMASPQMKQKSRSRPFTLSPSLFPISDKKARTPHIGIPAFLCLFHCFKNASTKRSVSARSCCAVVPRMARPGRICAAGIAARILSGVLVSPLPSCVQKGMTVFPEKS